MDPSPVSPLFERVIGQILPPHDLKTRLLGNIALGALDLLVQRALWRPVDKVVPPQYAVFDMVGRPATIFNFNLDKLASIYCGHIHIVLTPHGSYDQLWIEGANYEEARESTTIYGIVLPHLTPKLLPSPEPAYITQRPAYKIARGLFKFAPAMLMIGYSFARYANAFDDYESLEYFVELLKRHPKPVFVLSPYPEELVDILQQRLSSYNVYGFPLRWEVFSRFLTTSFTSQWEFQGSWCNEQLRAFVYLYKCAEERQLAA